MTLGAAKLQWILADRCYGDEYEDGREDGVEMRSSTSRKMPGNAELYIAMLLKLLTFNNWL